MQRGAGPKTGHGLPPEVFTAQPRCHEGELAARQQVRDGLLCIVWVHAQLGRHAMADADDIAEAVAVVRQCTHTNDHYCGQRGRNGEKHERGHIMGAVQGIIAVDAVVDAESLDALAMVRAIDRREDGCASQHLERACAQGGVPAASQTTVRRLAAPHPHGRQLTGPANGMETTLSHRY